MENKKFLITKSRYDAYCDELKMLEGEPTKKLARLLAVSPGSGMGRPNDLPIHKFATDFYNHIKNIKNIINNSEIIEDIREKEENQNKVIIGSFVLLEFTDGEKEEFYVLGEKEVDTSKNRISYLSPIGKAISGRVVGDEVELLLPSGITHLKILSVKRPALNFHYQTNNWSKSVDLYYK